VSAIVRKIPPARGILKLARCLSELGLVCSKKLLAHQSPLVDCVVMDKGGVISPSSLASSSALVVRNVGEYGDIRLT
jgi:hypothetical protein